MTAQTQVQRNRSYRQRRAEKLARMEAALVRVKAVLSWLSDNHPGCYGFEPPFPSTTPSITEELKAVNNALNPGKEMGE